MEKRRLYIVMGGMLFWLCVGCWVNAVADELQLFVGAGLRQPMDQLVQAFQEQSGHRVFVDYGGSGQLLTKIKASGKGDLFIPGAFFYIEKLQKENNVHSYQPIVSHTPVIGVNIQQAQKVRRFEDLTKPGVRLAMGDPKAMAFGRTAMSICEQSGHKEAILKNVTVYGATVKQLAMYVSQGVVDAAIIGRSDAFQNSAKITIVPIPTDYFQPEVIAAAVLKSASNPVLAQKLSQFLSSADAVAVFQKYGFLPLKR